MTRETSIHPLLPIATLLAACAAGLACQPPLPSIRGASAEADPPEGPTAALEPEAPFDAAPRVVRVRISPEEEGVADSSLVLFVRDHVGPGHVRQLEAADISKALAERALPAIVWEEPDGAVVVAPGEALEPGARYGVLSGDPPLGIDVTVAPSDPVPLLVRAWPPPENEGAGAFGVFCGEAELSGPPERLALSPGEIEAVTTATALAEIAPQCLRIDVLDPPVSAAPAAVPPALLTLADGSIVRLDPRPIPITSPAAASPLQPLACAPPAHPFGPGCAIVADDRLFVTCPEAPLFWAVRPANSAGPTTLKATSAGATWTLLGLAPASPIDLAIVALDASGLAHTGSLATLTEPPMPHVVITEVLANPLGPEPDQEWIELQNDGLAAADLSMYSILDIGGETPLPSAMLPPGAFALVVNEAFVEDDEIDPKPAAGTLILRVAKLGKDGLKNDGEPLKLRAADGSIASRFPPLPKPKAGQSVARVEASAPDGEPASFTVGTPTPGGPCSEPR